MPHDYPTLVILGIGAAVLLWLIFSVMKKLFGLALIAALVFGGYMLWTNPDLQQRALDLIGIG